MNPNVIRSYIEARISNYWWYLGEYRFPIFIKDNLNLKELYRSSLKNNTSPYQLNWENTVNLIKTGIDTMPKREKYLYSGDPFRYYKEFPLLIDNKSDWEYCLSFYGILNKGKTNEKGVFKYYKDKHYFLADYFFPGLGIIVEIDSFLHDPLLDKARDLYIKRRYLLKTLRSFKFDYSMQSGKDFVKLFRKEAKDVLKTRSRQSTCINYSSYIDTSMYSIMKWVEENPMSNYIFTHIENNYLYKTSPGDTIRVSLKELGLDNLEQKEEYEALFFDMYGETLDIIT